MDRGGKQILVVGDRVLVRPEEGEDRTRVGLLLPQAAVDKMAIQSGRVVEVGPGTPVPSPADFGDEPWRANEQKTQFVPMQAEIGDLALFLRSAAVEIEFDGDQFLIVPHAAILLLVRAPDELDPTDLEAMLRLSDSDGDTT